MNKSHLTRIFAALIAALAAVSGTAWADRDRHQSGTTDDSPPAEVAPKSRRGATFRQDTTFKQGTPLRQGTSRNWSVTDDRRDTSGQSSSRSRARDSTPLQPRLYDDRGDYYGNRRDGPRPVNDVIREVQDRYGGQVIGVQQSAGGMYRVRVLQRNGRVKNVLVPAD